MAKPINLSLRARLDQLAALATTKGVNVWDLLNEAGLLYTNDRQRTERVATLKRAASDLDAMTPLQLMGSSYRSGSFTAGDMRRGLIDQLSTLAENERKAIDEGPV